MRLAAMAGDAVNAQRLRMLQVCVQIAWCIAAISTLVSGPALAQTTQEWQAVIDGAKREGKVVVYSAASPPMPSIYAGLFEKRYGIPVETLEARPSELRERVRVEQSTGRFSADVILVGNSTAYFQAESGTFDKHGPIPNARKLLPALHDDGVVVPFDISRFGILINTKLVNAADEPKSWFDLLDPKWQDKILSDDPRKDGAGNAAFSGLYTGLGDDFHKRLAKQKLVFAAEPYVAERRTAMSEYPIYIPFHLKNIQNYKGLPVKAVNPIEGVPVSPTVAAVAKNAPRPNAARLYIDFLISEEAQAELVDRGGSSPIGQVSSKQGPELAAVANGKILVKVDPSRQREIMEIFKVLYK
jgi:iron(III) transport system substrate-binding protein